VADKLLKDIKGFYIHLRTSSNSPIEKVMSSYTASPVLLLVDSQFSHLKYGWLEVKSFSSILRPERSQTVSHWGGETVATRKPTLDNSARAELTLRR
jgi:hypothetical protein